MRRQKFVSQRPRRLFSHQLTFPLKTKLWYEVEVLFTLPPLPSLDTSCLPCCTCHVMVASSSWIEISMNQNVRESKFPWATSHLTLRTMISQSPPWKREHQCLNFDLKRVQLHPTAGHKPPRWNPLSYIIPLAEKSPEGCRTVFKIFHDCHRLKFHPCRVKIIIYFQGIVILEEVTLQAINKMHEYSKAMIAATYYSSVEDHSRFLWMIFNLRM